MSSIDDDVVQVTVSEVEVDLSDVQKTRTLTALFLTVLGSLISLVGFGGVVQGLACFVCVAVGFGLLVGGLLQLVVCFDVCGFVADFRGDRKGLGYQLIMFVVGLGVFSFLWFALGWPAEIIFNAFSSMYVFSGFSATALNFAQGVIRLMPGIFFIISLLWLWVSTHRHEEVNLF